MVVCAAFGKESRMKFVTPTKLYRKSGEWGTRDPAAMTKVSLSTVVTIPA